MKLVIEDGHWATKNNDMIFGNVVWLINKNEAYSYHLVDDNHQEIELEYPITHYIVEN